MSKMILGGGGKIGKPFFSFGTVLTTAASRLLIYAWPYLLSCNPEQK